MQVVQAGHIAETAPEHLFEWADQECSAVGGGVHRVARTERPILVPLLIVVGPCVDVPPVPPHGRVPDRGMHELWPAATITLDNGAQHTHGGKDSSE